VSKEQRWRNRYTHDQVDDEQASSSPHQTLSSSEPVNNLSGDDGANDSDGVESTCESVLLDCAISSLLQQNWTVGGDGGDTWHVN
jgi:hypothetical protein